MSLWQEINDKMVSYSCHYLCCTCYFYWNMCHYIRVRFCYTISFDVTCYTQKTLLEITLRFLWAFVECYLLLPTKRKLFTTTYLINSNISLYDYYNNWIKVINYCLVINCHLILWKKRKYESLWENKKEWGVLYIEK